MLLNMMFMVGPWIIKWNVVIHSFVQYTAIQFKVNKHQIKKHKLITCILRIGDNYYPLHRNIFNYTWEFCFVRSVKYIINGQYFGTVIMTIYESHFPIHFQRHFLCQLTCQSADIMSSLCGVGVRVRVRVNNFSSKTTRPRDVLFFLKDTLSIEDEKLFKACKSVCSSVC